MNQNSSPPVDDNIQDSESNQERAGRQVSRLRAWQVLGTVALGIFAVAWWDMHSWAGQALT